MNKASSAYETDQAPGDVEYDASDPAAPDDRQFATTLARGLELLRCFSAVRPVMGNKELADRMQLSRPTISRFTYTLCKLGYLRSDAISGKYRLAPAVLSLGYPLLASIGIRQLARPLMNELAGALRCSVSMGIRDRLSIVYVDTTRSPQASGSQLSDIGLRYPIASTAIGHAYVAGCDTSTRQSILNEVRVKTPGMWASYRDRLTQAQEELRQKGFCTSYGEQHPEYHAVAVPLGRPVDGELIVFNCVCPAHIASHSRVESVIGPKLVAMVTRLRESARAG